MGFAYKTKIIVIYLSAACDGIFHVASFNRLDFELPVGNGVIDVALDGLYGSGQQFPLDVSCVLYLTRTHILRYNLNLKLALFPTLIHRF